MSMVPNNSLYGSSVAGGPGGVISPPYVGSPPPVSGMPVGLPLDLMMDPGYQLKKNLLVSKQSDNKMSLLLKDT